MGVQEEVAVMRLECALIGFVVLALTCYHSMYGNITICYKIFEQNYKKTINSFHWLHGNILIHV